MDIDLATLPTQVNPFEEVPLPRPRLRTVSLRPRVAYVDPDRDIRPTRLDDIIGCDNIKGPLKVAIRSALRRGEPLDHVFFDGPPGLGKTTFANVIATEMGMDAKVLNGPALTEGDIIQMFCAGVQEGLAEDDPIINPAPLKPKLYFIDEIHGVHPKIMTMLLPLVEDFRFGDLRIPPFTLVGATTDPGRVSRPLLDRFGIRYRLDFYNDEDIGTILGRTLGRLLDLSLDDNEGSKEPYRLALASLARRARGVPRNANTLLRRTLDFIEPEDDEEGEDSEAKLAGLTPEIVSYAMKALDIDHRGLTRTDRNLLDVMCRRFKCRPTGIRALASAVGESPETLETTIEPALVRLGLIDRTPKGRELTPEGVAAAIAHHSGTTVY